jgi:hypothetical protein
LRPLCWVVYIVLILIVVSIPYDRFACHN